MPLAYTSRWENVRVDHASRRSLTPATVWNAVAMHGCYSSNELRRIRASNSEVACIHDMMSRDTKRVATTTMIHRVERHRDHHTHPHAQAWSMKATTIRIRPMGRDNTTRTNQALLEAVLRIFARPLEFEEKHHDDSSCSPAHTKRCGLGGVQGLSVPLTTHMTIAHRLPKTSHLPRHA